MNVRRHSPLHRQQNTHLFTLRNYIQYNADKYNEIYLNKHLDTMWKIKYKTYLLTSVKR